MIYKIYNLLKKPCTKANFIVVVIYLLLALIMTFPLVLNFNNGVPGGGYDLWQNYWNFWWWKKAIFELHTNPFSTKFLFFPDGINLAFHTHSPLNMLIGLPFCVIFGPGAAYNIVVWFNLAMAGIGAYALVQYITKNNSAAFFAGCIFAFNPMQMSQTLEHINLISTGFIPIVFLYLFRTLEEGRRYNGLLVGVSFALTTLGCFHIGLMTILAVFVALAFLVPTNKQQTILDIARNLTIGAGATIIILFPVIIPMLIELWNDATYFQKSARLVNIRLIELFIPHPGNPILGHFSRHPHVYLGWIPIVLAVIAILKYLKFFKKQIIFWSIVFVTFTIIALGDIPLEGKKFYNIVTLPQIHLPHYWIQKIPVLSVLRFAHRFMVLAMLGLAVLAGIGLSGIIRDKNKQKWLVPIIICFVLVEYTVLPYPVRPIKEMQHPYYRKIASNPDKRAVLNIPVCCGSSSVQGMFYQTEHEHPIIGGYTSTSNRHPIFNKLLEDPFLKGIIRDRSMTAPPDIEKLRSKGVRWVILNMDFTDEMITKKRNIDICYSHSKGLPLSVLEEISQTFMNLVGTPVYKDDRIQVFDLEHSLTLPCIE